MRRAKLKCYSRTSIIQDLDYPNCPIIRTFFSGPVFLWVLISCHLENLKLQIDQLKPFERLLKQRIIFVRKWNEKFLK